MQLPRFIDKKVADEGRIPRSWTDLRQAQWDLQRLPHVHTVVTLDQGEFNNLHPHDKEPIGQRLALAARLFVYGDGSAHGAALTALGAQVDGTDGERITVRFARPVHLDPDAVTGPVLLGDTGFELAGDDGLYHPATASVSPDGLALTLDCPQVRKPRRVRYGWRNWTAAPLFDDGNLPVAPFQLTASR